jgi:hypothetical protein
MSPKTSPNHPTLLGQLGPHPSTRPVDPTPTRNPVPHTPDSRQAWPTCPREGPAFSESNRRPKRKEGNAKNLDPLFPLPFYSSRFSSQKSFSLRNPDAPTRAPQKKRAPPPPPATAFSASPFHGGGLIQASAPPSSVLPPVKVWRNSDVPLFGIFVFSRRSFSFGGGSLALHDPEPEVVEVSPEVASGWTSVRQKRKRAQVRTNPERRLLPLLSSISSLLPFCGLLDAR